MWQKSMTLANEIYAVTAQLPKAELYGLVNQLQRASISIPSNIAEGSKRSSRADFRQFCLVALGPAAELETQLLLVKQLYPAVEVDRQLKDIVSVQKMLTSLAAKLK